MNTQSIGLLSICILVATVLPNCGALETATRSLSQVESANLIGDRTIGGTEPLSKACKQFRYKRYFRVNSYEDFQYFGQKAKAGDMVELVGGIYNLGNGKVDKDPSNQGGSGSGGNNGPPPSRAARGTITRRIGTKQNPIVFCGAQNKTIIDGADSPRYASYGIRIVNSQHIRLSGFITRNVMKGEKAIFEYSMMLKGKGSSGGLLRWQDSILPPPPHTHPHPV
jgi:hypothetical protein